MDECSSQHIVHEHRHIKKCKSATFTLDGTSYTIGKFRYFGVLSFFPRWHQYVCIRLTNIFAQYLVSNISI